MRRALRLALLSLASLTMIGFAPLSDSPTLKNCENGVCTMRMTAPQLLQATEKLILDRRFEEARPMLAALAHAPELSMERNFLEGYVAVETSQLESAAKYFRAVLRDRPDMVRARLELARVLMMEGREAAADHHYRLAAEAVDLPPEVEKTIRDSRAIIRGKRNWYFNFDFGLAPDSNINSATSATTVDTAFQTASGQPIVLDLNANARRKSGLGLTTGVQGGVRLRLSDGLAMAIDGDGQMINYAGKSHDDVSALLAAGPEVTVGESGRLAVQGVGFARFYGGKAAQKGGGARLTYQQDLARGQRINGRAEVRRYNSDYAAAYGGWSYAGSAGYERVVNKSMLASISAFARREDLRSRAHSNTELGLNAGLGGELKHGVNAGLTAGISRALYDAPDNFLSAEKRRDWRMNGRAYLGLRSVRVLGFSPSITYTFNRNASNVDFYKTMRHRFQFELARYF